jgi:hypothetical protein
VKQQYYQKINAAEAAGKPCSGAEPSRDRQTANLPVQQLGRECGWSSGDPFDVRRMAGCRHLRIPGRSLLDWGAVSNNGNNMSKNLHLTERLNMQLRFDALNLTNRSQMAGPSTDPLSTNFGKVTSQTAATNRWLQVQARIQF